MTTEPDRPVPRDLPPTRDADVILVRVAGLLTVATAPGLRATVLKCLADQPKLIILETSRLDFDDEVVLTVLPALARHAAAWPGSALAVCAPGPRLAAAL